MINHDLMLRQQEYYFQYGYFAYWETILLIDGSGELLGYVGYEPKRRKKIRWWTKLLEWVGYSDQSMFINDELVGQAILRTGSASKVRFILAMSDMEVIVYRSHLDIPAWLSSHQFATK